jgi:hypothetical protein
VAVLVRQRDRLPILIEESEIGCLRAGIEHDRSLPA